MGLLYNDFAAVVNVSKKGSACNILVLVRSIFNWWCVLHWWYQFFAPTWTFPQKIVPTLIAKTKKIVRSFRHFSTIGVSFNKQLKVEYFHCKNALNCQNNSLISHHFFFMFSIQENWCLKFGFWIFQSCLWNKMAEILSL